MQRWSDISGREAAAVAMALILVQGMLAGFVHFEVTSHFYCPEHQQVTHDASHASTGGPLGGLGTSDRPDREGRSAPEPLHGGDEDRNHGCQWLTWVNDSSHATPALQPALVVPASATDERSSGIVTDTRTAIRSVPLAHVSPINSPPRT